MADALQTEALTRVATDASLERVTDLLAEAEALYSAVGHLQGATRTRYTQASQAFRHDDLAAAEVLYREGLALAAITGNEGDLARGKTSLSIILDRRGRLADGLALKQEVLANYRRRDVKQGAAIMLENLGISLLKLGQPRAALVRFQEAVAAFEELGDDIGVAWAPYYQGRVWLELGELEPARRSFARALENAEDHPAGGLAPYTRFELTRIALVSGDLDRAETSAAALIAEFARLEKPGVAAETQVLQAQILAARGAWQHADTVASTAQEVLDGQQEAPLAAMAAVIRAEVALATAHPDSGPLCDDLARRLDGLEPMDVALKGRVTLTRCAWQRRVEPVPDLLDRIAATVAEAERLSLFEAGLVARQLQAELLTTAGEPLRAQAMREAVQQEASLLGWIADRDPV